ncbi:hypothetical protein DSO57_1024349 [Entomophthora muscae]|uniref:Uncharacterized protein n=1 Tax=Entomophthora muscae TaxID=34485 RepID=A0ACC2UCD5_9FUNG|nr:hypothetical protein DSO57_1024349 [Entomophthora muscae]
MSNTVKCNKRARATPEQQAFLESAFASNPSPNCKVRENMAQRVGMSERSIQIWFQNRRAKVKLNQRKASIAMQEEVLRQHCLVAPCPPNQLPCNVLAIGAWQRVANGGDLICSFTPTDRRLTWTLSEGIHRFQISFPVELVGGNSC